MRSSCAQRRVQPARAASRGPGIRTATSAAILEAFRPQAGAAPGLTRARRSESRNVRTGLPSPESKAAASGPESVPSRLAPRLRLGYPSPDAPGKASSGPWSTPGTAPTRTRVRSLTLPASSTPTLSPSPPHLRRLRQRWTQETPGSSTPALLDPPLRLTPLVSRQNGARGRALTSRPFPSQFPFHHSLPALVEGWP